MLYLNRLNMIKNKLHCYIVSNCYKYNLNCKYCIIEIDEILNQNKI